MKTVVFTHICGALRDLVPCAQFKKREKHPWRSVTFNKVAGWSQIAQSTTFVDNSVRLKTKLKLCILS